MKKVKLTLNNNAKDATFHLFPSVESAYVWISEGKNPLTKADCSSLCVERVTIEGDDFIEAEWCGCEFIYENDGSHNRVDCIRFVKVKESKNSAGPVTKPGFGWIVDAFKFKDSTDGDFNVKSIADDGKIDFPTVFSDEKDDDTSPFSV